MDERANQEIGKFYLDNRHHGKPFVVKELMAKGFSRSYIYKTLKRVDNDSPMKKQPKSGRPKITLSPKSRKSMRRSTVGKVALSYRSLGEKYGKDPKTVKRVLLDMGIKKKPRVVIPKSSEGQKSRQQQRLHKARKGLLRSRNGLDVVMDDESYFPFTYFGSKEHYFEGRDKPKRDIKFKEKEKFEPKLLMWLAISRKGRSIPFIMPSKMNVNAKVYQERMISDRLMPFLQDNYPNGGYVFWPDLASAHYANATQNLMKDLGITFVPKDQNPPAAPEVRPIEKFWQHLKSRVYKGGWKAKTEAQLRSRILQMLDTFDDQYFDNLMSKVKSKVRKAADYGLDHFR